MESLADDARRLVSTRNEFDQRADELDEQWNATEQVRNKVDRLRSDSEAAGVKRDSVASERQRRQELIGELEALTDQLGELDARTTELAPELAGARKHVEETSADLERVRAGMTAAVAEQARADRDRDHRRNLIEIEQLSERLERVSDAEQNLQEANTLLESIKVNDDLMQRIEDAYPALMSAEAAVASVETTALRDLTIEIDGEDDALGAGEARLTVVEEDLLLVVPDIAEIRVRAGAGSQSLATRRRHARQEFDRLCSSEDMADQLEARQTNEQCMGTERLHRDAQDTIKRDLRDLTVDVLRSRIDGLAKRTDTYAEDRPEDTPLPPDYETAREIAASTARTVEEKRKEFDDREQAAAGASDALQEERRNESNLTGKIEMVSSAHRRSAENLESARSQRTDDAIATELAEAEQDARLALESPQDAEKELSAVDPESLRLRLDNSRDAFRRAGDDLRANDDRQNELCTTLAVRGDPGLHTRHADAESRLRRLKRDYQRTEARADAARLLYGTFSQRRREARQRYSGPFKQRIEQLDRIVFNPSLSVDIDQGLRITMRSLNGDTLGVDQLSTGTLEQLAVLSRLACAAIVSPDGGGVPVIIDDALGWSDPDRLERMGAAIAAAGEHCQVIILTCTPGRCAHIGNATTIRLPA